MLKRFCLVSSGRSGSTSLMRVFESHSDIVVPPGNGELLNPKSREFYAKYVERSTGTVTDSPQELLERFFSSNESAAYAGFKLIPLQYKDVGRFLRRQDIKFI